ncbi:hypothetical protein FRC12_012752, partial [Ceratobasidium sp. 428]
MGITKGYNGVNGYVVVASLLFQCGEVTVKPNGHLVASPVFLPHFGPDPRSGPDASCYASTRFTLDSDLCDKTSNPATWLVLEIYNINTRRAVHPELATFLGDVAKLGRQTFTVLQVAHLAAKDKLVPGWLDHDWDEASAPPFTLNTGDIGYTLGQDRRTFWTPIKLGQVGLDTDTARFSLGWGCDHTHYRGSRAESDQWM